jgi:hypothetical protein
LLAVTCFCLLFAGLEGGLVDDERNRRRTVGSVDVRCASTSCPAPLRVERRLGRTRHLIDPDGASGRIRSRASSTFAAGARPAALGAALPRFRRAPPVAPLRPLTGAANLTPEARLLVGALGLLVLALLFQRFPGLLPIRLLR